MKSDAHRYGLWVLAAAGLHAGLLFGPWQIIREAATYNVSPVQGIEVSIVESAPAEPQIAATQPDPTPPPPVPPPSLPDPAPVPLPAKPKEPPTEIEKPNSLVELPRKSPKPKSTPAAHPRAAFPSNSASTTAVAGAASGLASKGAGTSAVTGNSSPGYLVNPHPAYPAESKTRHEQGSVMLAVSINERGEVTGISVSQSSGFPRLDQAARDGVSHWRFRPARVAGLPVASHLAVPVRFRLSE